MIRYTYDLDVVPNEHNGHPLVVKLNQYDSNVILDFRLFASRGEFELEEGTTAQIRGTKTDGNGISVDVDITDAVVTVPVTQQMTACPGDNRFEVVLRSAEKELNTANFILRVEASALDKDTIPSESVIRELVNVIDRTDEIIEAARTSDEAKERIIELEASASEAKERAIEEAAVARESAESAAADLAQIDEKTETGLAEIEEKMSRLVTITTNSDTLSAQALQKASNAENEVEEFGTRIEEMQQRLQSMDSQMLTLADALEVDPDGLVWLLHNGERIAGPYEGFAGGGGSGGGSGTAAKLAVKNLTGWISTTIAEGDDCVVSFEWESIEDEMPTGGGTLRIMSSAGHVFENGPIEQGVITKNLKPYLSAGTNSIRLTISDVYGQSRTINFTITSVSISNSSTFDPSVPYTGPIVFPYTPVGSVKKTVYLLLDGEEIATTVTSVSGRQQSFVIPQQTHGMHKLECYFTAEINGMEVRSNTLYSYNETSGVIYNKMFRKPQYKIRRQNDSAVVWSTRTAYWMNYSKKMMGVDINGNVYTLSSGVGSGDFYPCLGFCLGREQETITDSWEDILAAEEDGTYSTKYSIGDTKELDLGTEGKVLMQVAALDTDNLADESGKAKITWISKDCLPTKHSYDTSVKKWEESQMRTYLNDSIKPMLPLVVSDMIQPVTKISHAAGGQTSSTDELWIPSMLEIGVAGYESSAEPVYNLIFTDSASRKKRVKGEASSWCSRTITASRIAIIMETGESNGQGIVNAQFGVVLGFCT